MKKNIIIHHTSYIANNRGFTLFEVVIYVGIVIGMLASTFAIVTNILVAQEQSAINVEVYENTLFAMQKISWALDDAQTINAPAPNTTSTGLSVNKASSTENPFVFDHATNTLRLSTNGGSYVPLTNSQVNVDVLEFQHVSPSSTPASVRVTLIVSNIPKIGLSKEPYTVSTTIETTIFLTK